ncbi:MAG: hypothetical protein RL245_1650, partial [Pseudomonadota bacterium]
MTHRADRFCRFVGDATDSATATALRIDQVDDPARVEALSIERGSEVDPDRQDVRDVGRIACAKRVAAV